MNYAQLTTKYYCGIDLHVKTMYVCIKDKAGKVVYHRNMPTEFDRLYEVLKPYRKDISVGIEATYGYYWLADCCREAGIPFYLGHAYYMKAIGKAKKKNDRIDSSAIADLLRADLFPLAYSYPQEMRETRDLLRRRHRYVRVRADGYRHIQQVFHQQGITDVGENQVKNNTNRMQLVDRLDQPDLRVTIQTDLETIGFFDSIIARLEQHIRAQARHHNRRDYNRLMTIPGVGELLALVILYETHDISRFPKVQNYASYCRVVKCERSSAGKSTGGSGKAAKIGNPYLKWAFNDIIIVAKRCNPVINSHYQKLAAKLGPKKAKGRMGHKFCNAAYFMLKNGTAFDEKRFVGDA